MNEDNSLGNLMVVASAAINERKSIRNNNIPKITMNVSSNPKKFDSNMLFKSSTPRPQIINQKKPNFKTSLQS